MVDAVSRPAAEEVGLELKQVLVLVALGRTEGSDEARVLQGLEVTSDDVEQVLFNRVSRTGALTHRRGREPADRSMQAIMSILARV